MPLSSHSSGGWASRYTRSDAVWRSQVAHHLPSGLGTLHSMQTRTLSGSVVGAVQSMASIFSAYATGGSL